MNGDDEAISSLSFTGGLYGDGFVVSGLRFVSSVTYNQYPAGLITRLGSGGLISGVRLENAIVAAFPMDISGANVAMGGLVAFQDLGSKIVASRFSGDVFVYPDNNADNIGGLVGTGDGVIIDSSSSGRVGVNSSSRRGYRRFGREISSQERQNYPQLVFGRCRRQFWIWRIGWFGSSPFCPPQQ